MACRNPRRGLMCEPPAIKRIDYYCHSDLSLAGFIVAAAPHAQKKCQVGGWAPYFVGKQYWAVGLFQESCCSGDCQTTSWAWRHILHKKLAGTEWGEIPFLG